MGGKAAGKAGLVRKSEVEVDPFRTEPAMSQPETTEVAAAPKRRGRKPGSKNRKRHAEAEFTAPADGDWNQDLVLGKDPSKHYAYVLDEDVGRLLGQGVEMTNVERGRGVKSPYDRKTEGPITDGRGQLTLMECPKEMHEKAQRRQQSGFARRFGAETDKINDHIARNGGVGENNKFIQERV